MSSQNAKLFVTRKAEADLSAKQYTIVTKGTQPGNILSATPTDYPIGILQDKPRLNEVGTIAIDGIAKVVAGGTVTELAYCGADAQGRGVVATTGVAVGVFLDPGVLGDVVRIDLRFTKLS